MRNKTILGMWCTNLNCKFIDVKHIQIELTASIWYSYDNDSRTDVINKEFCFVNEIDFNELNDKVEILEEEKIPEKIDNWTNAVGRVDDSNIEEYVHKLFEQQTILFFKVNSIIDCLKKEE